MTDSVEVAFSSEAGQKSQMDGQDVREGEEAEVEEEVEEDIEEEIEQEVEGVDTDNSANGSEANDVDKPIAFVKGEQVLEIPRDLFIPPDAMEVILESFEGPLDLLLYLVRKHSFDILDIPVAEITRQYMGYVDIMKAFQLELAGEYLVMAALLGEIKSRSLLPRPETAEDEEEDPRAELIRRLQAYEVIKAAATELDELPRTERDTFPVHVAVGRKEEVVPPTLNMSELLLALREVLRRADMLESHHVKREELSTRERMSRVLEQLKHEEFIPFEQLFDLSEGRLGVVVSFLAILELVKEGLIDIAQVEALGPIHIRQKSRALEAGEESSGSISAESAVSQDGLIGDQDELIDNQDELTVKEEAYAEDE